MARYLTAGEKTRRLAEWESLRSQPLPDGDCGGRGYPDPDIFPLCDYLNALPGVCTLQSCAGHRSREGLISSAHLWLKLDRTSARRFKKNAFVLAGDDHIERLGLSYMPDEGEVVEIIFKGNERGMLVDSALPIASFFEDICHG